GLDQQLELEGVLAVAVPADVGAGGDPNAGLPGAGEAAQVVLAHGSGADLLELGTDGAVPEVDGEGRDVPGAAAGHLGHALVVQPAAVLDRVDPGPHGHEHPGAADRVAGDRYAGHVGLVDDGLDLFLREDLLAGIDLRGADAAGRGDLDDVGAGSQDLAHSGAGLVGAAALGARHARQQRRGHALLGGGIEDAVGRADDDQAALQARAGE